MAYMSQEGYDNLIAELKRLEGVERPNDVSLVLHALHAEEVAQLVAPLAFPLQCVGP